MQLAQMLHLAQMGVPIPPEELLEASTIQNKTRIIESMKAQKEQQGQMQQQQFEMQMQQQQIEIQKLQAEIKDITARGFANTGLGEERLSRVSENRSLSIERLHRANVEDQRATLDLVKSLKELEMLDLSHLEKLISMVHSLKQSEVQTSEQGVGQVAQIPIGAESQQIQSPMSQIGQ